MSTQKLATPFSITFTAPLGIYTITWSSTYPALSFGAAGCVLFADPTNSNWIWFGDTTDSLTCLDWQQCTSPMSDNATDLIASILAMNTGFAPLPLNLTAVTTDILPAIVDSTCNIGNDTYLWKSVYANELVANDALWANYLYVCTGWNGALSANQLLGTSSANKTRIII